MMISDELKRLHDMVFKDMDRLATGIPDTDSITAILSEVRRSYLYAHL